VTTSPEDQQELEKEIDQTREQLGQTVEALTAKVDVRARAQQKLSQLTARLKGKAIEARDKAKQLRPPGNLPDKAKRQATQAGQQIKKRPAPAAASASGIVALVLFFIAIRRWMRQ
jgi:hypothetical protein